jgi:hypothetical protein
MNMRNQFDPQISPIGADEARACPFNSRRLPDTSWTSITSLFYLRNLRHLRTAWGFRDE